MKFNFDPEFTRKSLHQLTKIHMTFGNMFFIYQKPHFHNLLF